MKHVLFMHIHKTAGTALARQCFESPHHGAICPARFEWQIIAAGMERLRSYAIFHGHIAPAALAGLGDVGCLTMLREPRARLLSAYFYWKGNAAQAPDSAFYRRVAGLDLLGFLRCNDPIIHDAIFNVQARLLAGGRFGVTNDLRTNVGGPDAPPGEIAAMALAGMDRFAVVGIAERYADSLTAACAWLDVARPDRLERHNEGVNVPVSGYETLFADAAIAAELQRLTEIDTIIYQKANRCLAHGDALPTSVPCARLEP